MLRGMLMAYLYSLSSRGRVKHKHVSWQKMEDDNEEMNKYIPIENFT